MNNSRRLLLTICCMMTAVLLYSYRYFNLDKIVKKIKGPGFHGSVMEISTDTTFMAADSPIRISDYVVVRKNATLTIEPGVNIIFNKRVGIISYGKIVAKGNRERGISFTSKRGKTPWTNIILIGSGTNGTVFKYCNISNCYGQSSSDDCLPELCLPNDEIDVTMLSGGSIICYNASPTIEDCTFKENVAPGVGGAICVIKGSKPLITNNTFIENRASFHGGAVSSLKSSPIIKNNIFIKNHSRYKGGGLFIEGGKNFELFGNKFDDNSSELGGGIYIQETNVSMRESSFKSNSSEAGGGIIAFNSWLSIKNSSFMKNSADFTGGAIYLSSANADIIENIINGNKANSGGGIYEILSNVNREKNIISDNKPNDIEHNS